MSRHAQPPERCRRVVRGLIAAFPVVAAASLGPTVLAQTPAPAADPAATPPPATEPAPETSSAADRLIERMLFNPRERTARGLEALEAARASPLADDTGSTGAPETASPGTASPGTASPGAAPPGPLTPDTADRALRAIPPLDTAARLRSDDPLSQFNAGTARLVASRADAVPLLESALAAENDDLAARAAYNLGNAHLETDNLQGAVDAYKSALRRKSDYQAAKHNLEIAMRRLREQQQQQQQGQDDQQQQDGNQDEQQDQQQQQDGDQQDQEQQDQQEQQQDGEQDQQQQDGDQDQQDQQQQDGDQQDQEQQNQQDQQEQPQDGEQGQEQERPLPNFEDQPDMTAEEAAAILEAVENLEREARRQEALEAAASQAKTEKDW